MNSRAARHFVPKDMPMQQQGPQGPTYTPMAQQQHRGAQFEEPKLPLSRRGGRVSDGDAVCGRGWAYVIG